MKKNKSNLYTTDGSFRKYFAKVKGKHTWFTKVSLNTNEYLSDLL
jgi:hypothetical protein